MMSTFTIGLNLLFKGTIIPCRYGARRWSVSGISSAIYLSSPTVATFTLLRASSAGRMIL
jgi:hypothetical protein